jgi:hypothetical protein
MNPPRDPLPVVDGLRLPADLRALLRPDEPALDRFGRTHRLPRFFYEVRSWSQAREFALTAHVRLSELMIVDCRESPRLLEEFPHYVPCAVGLLARALEDFRARAGASVHIAANGGYRSPAHRLCAGAGSIHCWAAAADIYRVGDTLLNTQAAIEKYGALARDLGLEINALPYGHQPGETDDHLHFDLGYAHLIPPGCDEAPPPNPA